MGLKNLKSRLDLLGVFQLDGDRLGVMENFSPTPFQRPLDIADQVHQDSLSQVPGGSENSTFQDLDVTGNNILIDHGGSMSGVTTIGSYYYDRLVINSAIESDNAALMANNQIDIGWPGSEFGNAYFTKKVRAAEFGEFNLISI